MSYENMKKYDEELANALIHHTASDSSINASEYLLSGGKISGVAVHDLQKLDSKLLEYLSQNNLPLVLIPYKGYGYADYGKHYINGKEVDKWYNDELAQ